MSELSPHARRLRADYLKGFAAALLPTAIPFGLAVSGVLAPGATLGTIAALAVVQILVHLRYFLHLDLTQIRNEKVATLAFTGILLFLMIGGSLWIMSDLSARMM